MCDPMVRLSNAAKGCQAGVIPMGTARATAIIFGLAPGLKMSRSNLQEALKDSGQGLSEGKKHESLRAALVISELALACVLLVGADCYCTASWDVAQANGVAKSTRLLSGWGLKYFDYDNDGTVDLFLANG